MDLEASDEQLDCPFLYASAKAGHAVLDLSDTPENMEPLFETILKYIPAPEGDPDADTQVLISTIDYNEYVGRIGVGKVENGKIAVNQELTLLNHHDLDKRQKVKISKLYEFDGLNKVEAVSYTHLHRFYRGCFRYCRYPYRRYPLRRRQAGIHPIPENLRAYNFHELPCK